MGKQVSGMSGGRLTPNSGATIKRLKAIMGFRNQAAVPVI
jgi:hypothetical protein